MITERTLKVTQYYDPILDRWITVSFEELEEDEET